MAIQAQKQQLGNVVELRLSSTLVLKVWFADQLTNSWLLLLIEMQAHSPTAV